jgi:hypothetical protein
VFRFIIEYNSFMDFGPHVVDLFLCKDFWKMIFWLVLKLGINDRVCDILKEFGFFYMIFFSKDYIIAWWNIGISIIFFFLKILFLVNGKAMVTHQKDGNGKFSIVIKLVTKIPF